MRVSGDVMTAFAALPAYEQANAYREAAREAEYFGRANDAVGAHYRALAERWRRLADDLELDDKPVKGARSCAATARGESPVVQRD
jgi:hypothetical protein